MAKNAVIFDEDGNVLDQDVDVVPPGGRLSVRSVAFMDTASVASLRRVFDDEQDYDEEDDEEIDEIELEDAVEDAYAKMKSRVSNAWRDPPSWQRMPKGSRKPKPGRARDSDISDVERAYIERNQMLSDAWKSPPSVQPVSREFPGYPPHPSNVGTPSSHHLARKRDDHNVDDGEAAWEQRNKALSEAWRNP